MELKISGGARRVTMIHTPYQYGPQICCMVCVPSVNALHYRPVLKLRDGTFAWLVDLARGVRRNVCSGGKKIPSNGYVICNFIIL